MAENSDAESKDDIDGLLDETLLKLDDEEAGDEQESLGDDQLMAELDELMKKEEHADSEQGGADADAQKDLDELDAFLDDFGNGAAAGEDNAGAEDIPVLDLDVEPTGSMEANEEDPSEIVLEDVYGAELDAAIDEASGPEPKAEETAPEPAASKHDEPATKKQAKQAASKQQEEEPVNGKLIIAALAFGVLGVLAAGGGGYLAYDAHQQLGAVKDSVQQLKAGSANKAQGKGELMELKAELGLLSQRLNEMAVILEGPMSHVQESNKEELGAIMARLDASDAALKSMNEKLAKLESSREAMAKQAASSPAQSTPSKPARLVQATESAAGAMPTAAKGGWKLNLTSMRSEVNAQSELARLRKGGVKAEISRAKVGGDTWYRLSVPGFASKAEAQAYGKQLKTKYGLNPWITRN